MTIPRTKLQELELFKNIPQEALDELEKTMKVKTYPRGSLIVKHNDIAKEMFFIISGDVDIIDAQCRTFAHGHSGQFFGELGLIYSIPRTASVRAATDVELCMLVKDDFDGLRAKVPAIEAEVKHLAMERLSRFQVELVRLASIPEEIGFTPDQFQVFREVFSYWDRNSDDKLGKNEVRELLEALSGKFFSEEESNQIVRMLDTDQDGMVSFDDFVKKIRTLGWFLAPTENRRIKKKLGEEWIGGEGGKGDGILDGKSVMVGFVVGVVVTMSVVWWCK